MTGLVLVTSIMKNPSIDMGNITDGGVLTTLAFQQIPILGPVILVVGIISFAYSTVLGGHIMANDAWNILQAKKGSDSLSCSLHCCCLLLHRLFH